MMALDLSLAFFSKPGPNRIGANLEKSSSSTNDFRLRLSLMGALDLRSWENCADCPQYSGKGGWPAGCNLGQGDQQTLDHRAQWKVVPPCPVGNSKLG